VLELDAHELPFDEASFDVVLLFEAIYYLERPERFLEECRRVLRDGGVVMISSANPERVDFQPSPHSVRYYSARELGALLRDNGFEVELSAAFGLEGSSTRGAIVSLGKGMAQENLLERALLGNGVHNVQIIELVRERKLEHRHGRVQGLKFVNTLPGIHVGEPFSAELSRHVSSASRGTFSSPTFVGVVYIDFGMWGVIAVFFAVGAFLAALSHWLFRRRNDVLGMAIVVSIISFVPGFALSGFTGFLPTCLVLAVFHMVFRSCGAVASAATAIAGAREPISTTVDHSFGGISSATRVLRR
jgi:hypothetical protein